MSLHMVKAGRQASPRPRRDLPILPFAEIYTVINLVSIDLEATSVRGWRSTRHRRALRRQDGPVTYPDSAIP